MTGSVGGEAPACVFPDPTTLFRRRAERFRVLAVDHQMAAYLAFLADLSDIQHDCLTVSPSPAPPAAGRVETAIAHGMPVISRPHVVTDAPLLATIGRLLDRATSIAMPDQAALALDRLSRAWRVGSVPWPDADRSGPPLTIAGCVDAVLNEAVPADAIAEHIIINAALQSHFARLAAEPRPLAALGDYVCPFCGGPPASSAIVGWAGIDRLRYATCALCATRWNAVRVKCLACSSTKGIHYQTIEGIADTIKAECCDECQCYVKIMAEDEHPELDPIADDVASLGLDLLVREAGYRRAGMNPFLLGF